MSFRIDMTSTDVDRQIELLKFYPEVMEKYFREALQRSVKLAESEIRPTVPVGATSKARNTFKSRVTGSGINLQGQVGWWGKGTAWHINVVEHGAKPHTINNYAPGAHAYIKKHPGFSARGFMAAGFSAVQPLIDAEMATASEGVVKEMAVP